jgi:cell wall-associated NlpC family hydrolase
VIEQYNATSVALAATKVKEARLTKRLVPLHRSVAEAQARVGTIAASVYQASSLGTFARLLDAASTSDLVNQLSMINQVAFDREKQINALYSAASTYLTQQKSLTVLDNAQSNDDTVLKEKRDSIRRRIAQLKSLRYAAYGPAGMPAQNTIDDFVPVFSPGMAGQAVRFAFDQLGKAYKWAASGPNSYDCSGLTMASWKSAGVKLPHNAAMQYNVVKHITRAQLLPGDLVFYFNPVHHVGIYIGAGKIINAPTYGRPVAIAPVDMATIHGYGRP